MPAPKGNRFWEARSTHGRKPIFKTPEKLFEACQEYFIWVEDNPLYEAKAFFHQGEVTIAQIPKMRAMTIGGLCTFLDIDRTTWLEYTRREGFSNVTRAIEEIIKNQKFVGAAADLLNANIIARDLGLADKSELTAKDGAPLIPVGEVSKLDLARWILFTLKQAADEKDKESSK